MLGDGAVFEAIGFGVEEDVGGWAGGVAGSGADAADADDFLGWGGGEGTLRFFRIFNSASFWVGKRTNIKRSCQVLQRLHFFFSSSKILYLGRQKFMQ